MTNVKWPTALGKKVQTRVCKKKKKGHEVAKNYEQITINHISKKDRSLRHKGRLKYE
jgi:hypothetical protein